MVSTIVPQGVSAYSYDFPPGTEQTDSSGAEEHIHYPMPDNNIHDPLLWSNKWKHLTFGIGVWYTFFSTVPLLAFNSIYPTMMQEFRVGPSQLSQSAGWAGFVIAFGVFIVVPASSAFGRRPMLFYSNLMSIGCLIWYARVDSYVSLIWARNIGGLAVAAIEIVAITQVGDLYFTSEAGMFHALGLAHLIVAVSVGAPVLGAIVQAGESHSHTHSFAHHSPKGVQAGVGAGVGRSARFGVPNRLFAPLHILASSNMPSTLGGPAQFRPRQSSYLRISPTTVLQLILYLEPAHVHWMTAERLERVLFALKERIPTKLSKETEGVKKRSSAKEKTIVDVYRGADYQIAFFFRRTGKKHVVLLKDKHLAHPLPNSPPPAPVPQETGTKRGREGSEMLDLTGDVEEGGRAPKRGGRPADDGLIAVKDEEVDVPIPEFEPGPGYEEDYKPEFDDVKPELRVEYKGYSIFNRSLVVIVEPYPALAPSELAKGAPLLPVEVRQLSEMPSDSARPSASRGLSESATPGPLRRDGQPLFRSDTTPLEEEATPALDDEMRQLRESTEMLANEYDEEGEEGDLPSLNDLFSKGRG